MFILKYSEKASTSAFTFLKTFINGWFSPQICTSIKIFDDTIGEL